MAKVIISCAVTGAIHTPSMSDYLPITPEEIAQLARGQAKRKIPQVIEALEGHRMSDHERLLIRSCLRHLACLEEEVEELDGEILRRMQMPPFVGPSLAASIVRCWLKRRPGYRWAGRSSFEKSKSGC